MSYESARLEFEAKDIDHFYCTRDLDCYKVEISTKQHEKLFSWSEKPSSFVADDYYAIALIGSTIELRSLKSGNLLQLLSLDDAHVFNFETIIYVNSPHHVWRLLPLDFDDQIDDLLANNRFLDAEALLEELEFSSEDEKRQNVIKVKGVYAQYLFGIEKKYSEAIQILENLKASPLDIVELFPDIMDENIEERSDELALKELGRYLARERVKLHQFNIQLSKKLSKESDSLVSFRSLSTTERMEQSIHDTNQLLEFVETALLHTYLVTNNPLLGPLLRVENNCNYDRTVALLLKHRKHSELIDFYRAKRQHSQALLLLRSLAQENEFGPTIDYLLRLDMNTELEIVFAFSQDIISKEPDTGLRIFTEHYQEVDSVNRRKIFTYLHSANAEIAKKYLEHLVIENGDNDVEINNSLFRIYLQEATMKKAEPHIGQFIHFLMSTDHYDPEIALSELPTGGTIALCRIPSGKSSHFVPLRKIRRGTPYICIRFARH
jgi:hypothetical protein